jgi:hypothetical protein
MNCRLLVRLLCAGFWVVATGYPAFGDQLSPELCILPVTNGRPTEADVGSVWRMANKVVTLPGIPRPIIYAYNRGGVWTIDEAHAFVPFGGTFPANMLYDEFSQDPVTKRIVGVNYQGLFFIEAGQTQFMPISLAGTGVSRPTNVTFVPRLNGFVVSDPSGLYLLDRQLAWAPLPVTAPADYRGPGRTFDLPEIDAFLVASSHRAYLRFDDGKVVLIATLEEWDFVTDASINSADRSIDITTYRNRFSVAVPERFPDGLVGEAVDARLVRARPERAPFQLPTEKLVQAPSVGKVLLLRQDGLWEKIADRLVPISLPFEMPEVGRLGFADFPSVQKLVIFAPAGIFTLDVQGRVEPAPGSRAVASKTQAESKGIIPIRNEMILTGNNALFLLMATDESSRDKCLE